MSKRMIAGSLLPRAADVTHASSVGSAGEPIFQSASIHVTLLPSRAQELMCRKSAIDRQELSVVTQARNPHQVTQSQIVQLLPLASPRFTPIYSASFGPAGGVL
jgi:hypothetical protein